MKTLISKYSKNYRRISISSDAVSQYASDIIFYGIQEWMLHEIPLTMKLSKSEPLSKLHFLDEYGYMENYDGAPFRVVVNNWYPNIAMDDGFIFRGVHWVGMDGQFRGVPSNLTYDSELIIQLVNNKLTIIKDRYGYEGSKYNNMDVIPYLRTSKIKTLIKNING